MLVYCNGNGYALQMIPRLVSLLRISASQWKFISRILLTYYGKNWSCMFYKYCRRNTKMRNLPLCVSRALYAAIKFPFLRFNLQKKTTRQMSSYKLFSKISNIIFELIPSRNLEYHQIPVKSTVSIFSISLRYLIHGYLFVRCTDYS